METTKSFLFAETVQKAVINLVSLYDFSASKEAYRELLINSFNKVLQDAENPYRLMIVSGKNLIGIYAPEEHTLANETNVMVD